MDKQKAYSFEDLEVWKEARKLRSEIENLIKKFPKEEKYRIVDQMTRAIRSVSNNIAEGYGRFHYQENIQFCRQSRGSLFEIQDDLIICNDNGYIDTIEYKKLKDQCNLVIKILNGYINYLIKQKEFDKIDKN